MSRSRFISPIYIIRLRTRSLYVVARYKNNPNMNNALIHLTRAANGDVWVIVAADRRTDTRDAYIDFEFLRKTLTVNSDGSFISALPQKPPKDFAETNDPRRKQNQTLRPGLPMAWSFFNIVTS